MNIDSAISTRLGRGEARVFPDARNPEAGGIEPSDMRCDCGLIGLHVYILSGMNRKRSIQTMKSSLRAGMAGLALLSFVAFLPSCTRDTGNAGKSTTTTTSSSSYQGSADTSSMSMSNTGTSGSNSSMGSPSMNSSSSGKLSLTAHLVDKDELAAQHAAVIEVNVSGIRLVDPDQKGSPAVAGSDNSAAGAAMSNREGHIHYRLDAGPIIATPATRLAFHDLSPGQHTITVMLAGDNHAPLGPQETLTFTVPAS